MGGGAVSAGRRDTGVDESETVYFICPLFAQGNMILKFGLVSANKEEESLKKPRTNYP